MLVRYIFLAAGSAVYIYSTVTSLLVQTLHVDSNQKIIGYKLFPAKQDCLYAFTSDGSIRTWEWTTGKQISHWDMCRAIISIDLGFSASDSMNHTFYCLCERSDGKREIRTFSMHGQKPSESVILETSTRFSHLRVSRRSQTIIAYGGHCLLLGFANATSHDMECTQYTWRETTLPVTITCLDVRQSTQSEQQDKKSGHATEQLDLVVGEAGGAILIYQDVLGLFLTCEGSRDGSNGPAVRRLHWHRGPVNALRWSRDGKLYVGREKSGVKTKFAQEIISYQVEMSPSWYCGNWIRVENNFSLTFPRQFVISLFPLLEIHTRLNWPIIALWSCQRGSYSHTPLSQAYSCRQEWPDQSTKLLHRKSRQQLYCIRNIPLNC